MNCRTFELPTVIKLNIPVEYARTHPAGPVTATGEVWADGLKVEWDDSSITFSSCDGSVTYKRSAIISYRVEVRRVTSWWLCQLNVEVGSGVDSRLLTIVI